MPGDPCSGIVCQSGVLSPNPIKLKPQTETMARGKWPFGILKTKMVNRTKTIG